MSDEQMLYNIIALLNKMLGVPMPKELAEEVARNIREINYRLED